MLQRNFWLVLVFGLGAVLLAPFGGSGSAMSPIAAAWAINCDADGDGYVKEHKFCEDSENKGYDLDDSDPCIGSEPGVDLCNNPDPGSGTDPGTVFYAEFGLFDDNGGCATGSELCGSGYSNETTYSNNIANLVFNKLGSDVLFQFDPADGSACAGDYGRVDALETTMHLLAGSGGLGADGASLVARLWFHTDTGCGRNGAKQCNYVLELFEATPDAGSEYGWTGAFPPFGGGSISRAAASWQIGSNGGKAGPCVGEGGTFDPPVIFTITPE